MKKITLILLFITTQLVVNAQTKAEKDVEAAVERLRTAMVSGDRSALENITANELSYGHSGGKIEDKATFVENIASGKSDFVSIDLANQTIKIVGKTAIVRHQLTAKTNDGGKPADVHLLILLIFQKQGGEWKMLARQAVKKP
jgi:ketosteroid isomerase-like protein